MKEESFSRGFYSLHRDDSRWSFADHGKTYDWEDAPINEVELVVCMPT